MFIKDFANRRLIATPIASLIAWCVVAVGSLFLEPVALSLLTFAATGSIVYLGLLVSKFTGENFLDKTTHFLQRNSPHNPAKFTRTS